MAKLWILTVMAVAVLVQVSIARELAEALDGNIREQLNLYGKFEKEPDSANYLDDLKKLITLTEEALKSTSAAEKEQAINNAHLQFSPEFNTWIGAKLEEAQVNDDIHESIKYYSSLLTDKVEHEADIKQTLSTLENLLKESNLKLKEEQFLGLTKTFTPEFENFLKQTALPGVNRNLQMSVEFFENLLHDKDIKFATEIEALKVKTEAALGDNVSIDEKNKVLREIIATDNQELNEYLQKKHVQYT